MGETGWVHEACEKKKKRLNSDTTNKYRQRMCSLFNLSTAIDHSSQVQIIILAAVCACGQLLSVKEDIVLFYSGDFVTLMFQSMRQASKNTS